MNNSDAYDAEDSTLFSNLTAANDYNPDDPFAPILFLNKQPLLLFSQ